MKNSSKCQKRKSVRRATNTAGRTTATKKPNLRPNTDGISVSRRVTPNDHRADDSKIDAPSNDGRLERPSHCSKAKRFARLRLPVGATAFFGVLAIAWKFAPINARVVMIWIAIASIAWLAKSARRPRAGEAIMVWLLTGNLVWLQDRIDDLRSLRGNLLNREQPQ